VRRLAALAHESRLAAFRLLVRAGPDGMAAGQLAARLGLGATAVSFHLNRLREAGLVARRRDGAQQIYSADFAALRQVRDFLDTECCAESADGCSPVCDADVGAATVNADAAIPGKETQ